MERAAWLAWHFLLPWAKKGSRLKPKDLLGDHEATRKATKTITKDEARRELAALVAEMEGA